MPKANYRDNGIAAPVRSYGRMNFRALGIPAYVEPSAALTGTFLTTPTESEVIAGTQTIIITLANGTWAATLSTAMKQAIIDAFIGAASETNGWTTRIQDALATSTVTRTNDTQATIILAAAPLYQIAADEPVTFDVPRIALDGSPGSPTVTAFTVDNDLPSGAVSAALTGTFLTTPTEGEVVTGSQTIIITLTNATWVAAGASAFNAVRQAIINGLVSDGEEATGWNTLVRDVMAVTTVTRTSNGVVTVILPATAGYSIAENETVTVTVPRAAIAGGDADVVATPTIEIVAS